MATDIIRRMLVALAAVVVSIVVSYSIGRRDGISEAASEVRERVDTMVVYDTITQYEAVVEERVALQHVFVPVMLTDTIMRHDTMYVSMEREQIIWQDSLSRIYASGIIPAVDSVQHFIQERVVTREVTKVQKTPCRWGVGINAGYGAIVDGRVYGSPYVGIGISYNIISW